VKEPSLRARRVARLPFALFAGEGYVARRGRPRTEEQLAGHDVLLLAGELAALPESRWLAAHPGVRVALRSTSMPALVAATLEGQGLLVLAGSWGDREAGLVRLFDVEALKPRPLWLVMHPDAAIRAAVKIVADHVAMIAGRWA